MIESRVLPVLTVGSVAAAAPLAEALADGGVRTVEVTLRTPAALQVIAAMVAHGGLTVGAGTVLTPSQAETAVAAGASFVVSPGFDDEIVAVCRELGVPVLPGVATATELMRAQRAGLDTVKLFPAEQVGGVEMIRALSAPFPGMRFVPTGGIGAEQVADYLAHPAVLAVGGSWMVRGDHAEIRRRTRDAVRRSKA